MKNALTLLFLCLATVAAQAQKTSEKKAVVQKIDSASVLTLDSTIKALYKVISGEKGVERNWEQFKYLFKPDSKLIPAGKDKFGDFKVRFLKPDDYIKSSGKWLVETGFVEKEIHRQVDSFGNISQVFSTYEAFYSESEKTPFMRGINSIQLLNDGKRWWIINVYWTHETKYNPIPKKYLN